MSIRRGIGEDLRIAVDVTSTFPRRVSAVPPQAYFVGSAVFHYLGPSFAVLLFARVDVLGVAWLRIASAALVFALWRRSWRRFRALDRGGRLLIVALGAVFAVVAAALGVYLLTHVGFAGQPAGIAFAFANAALFAVYIVLAHRLARRSAMGGIDGLAAAMIFALVFASAIGLRDAAQAFSDPVAIGAGIGVGISSSVIPYVCDQLAMAKLPRATYALFVSLLPATATVIGVVVLRQLPSLLDLGGIGLVMIGVALHRPEARRVIGREHRAGPYRWFAGRSA